MTIHLGMYSILLGGVLWAFTSLLVALIVGAWIADGQPGDDDDASWLDDQPTEVIGNRTDTEAIYVPREWFV